jgi:hypothetical protein
VRALSSAGQGAAILLGEEIFRPLAEPQRRRWPKGSCCCCTGPASPAAMKTIKKSDVITKAKDSLLLIVNNCKTNARPHIYGCTPHEPC